MSKRKILVLFFHPRFEDSKANSALVKAMPKDELITFWDVYERYPDFDIDVKQEQAQLLTHDVIVWQHPFYWYSCPPLMKQWIDLVLEYGWAYGKNGNQLSGKWFFNALTSAGDFQVYQKSGRNKFTYRELLTPFEQTVNLCQGIYLPPFIVPSAPRLSTEEMDQFSGFYSLILNGLQQQHLQADDFCCLNYFNDLTPEAWKARFSKMP